MWNNMKSVFSMHKFNAKSADLHEREILLRGVLFVFLVLAGI